MTGFSKKRGSAVLLEMLLRFRRSSEPLIVPALNSEPFQALLTARFPLLCLLRRGDRRQSPRTRSRLATVRVVPGPDEPNSSWSPPAPGQRCAKKSYFSEQPQGAAFEVLASNFLLVASCRSCSYVLTELAAEYVLPQVHQ